MKTRVIVRPIADAQFAQAHNQFDLLRRGRGDAFLLAVDERIEAIVAFPFSY